VLRADGEVEEVAGKNGMLLGIYPDPELVDQRLELMPGDSLVLFTDGLGERRHPHEDPAVRIREMLRESAGASANETALRLGHLALSDDTGPDDDVAVVVLRRANSREPSAAPGTHARSGSIAVELEPGRGCPAEARTAVAPLEGELADQAYLDLRLLVSELVTNCVRHARLGPGDLIRLQVALSERMLRVDVTDPGEGFSNDIPRPVPGRPGGWGLFLTERIADRWGVDRDEGWTTVWLEMDL
jgi:anti-sigma regulatory factor (Ser/Thr protein kinase)